jgi:hypothetical protein
MLFSPSSVHVLLVLSSSNQIVLVVCSGPLHDMQTHAAATFDCFVSMATRHCFTCYHVVLRIKTHWTSMLIAFSWCHFSWYWRLCKPSSSLQRLRDGWVLWPNEQQEVAAEMWWGNVLERSHFWRSKLYEDKIKNGYSKNWTVGFELGLWR